MCFTCTSNKRIHIEKLKREGKSIKHVIRALKLGSNPKREIKLYHGAQKGSSHKSQEINQSIEGKYRSKKFPEFRKDVRNKKKKNEK